MGTTQYKVLIQEESGIWTEFEGTVEATSTKGAIRRALNGEDQSGIYLAVPLRSFKPTPVKVETQQHLKIG